MTKHTINVVTRLQDNGDGGYTMYVYNNNEELIANHPLASEYKEVRKGKWEEVPVELSQEQIDDILNEDDPYANGYIGKDTIEIEVDENGVARLGKSLNFHAGQ